MGSDRGIFEPMFGRDLLEEVDDVMDAVDQASEDGLQGMDRWTQVEEARQKRERHEERQQMLLVERLVDELPEAFEYVKGRLATHGKAVADKLVVKTATAAVLGTETLATRFVGKVVEQVYRERMDRVEAMGRLGRKRPVPGGAPSGAPNPFTQQPVMEPLSSPEEDAANDIFDKIMAKVHSVLNPLRMWVARRQAKQSGWLEEP